MKMRRSAQAAIEFALVVPIFLFILVVMVDLGRAIFTYASLANAVREGTRYAIVHPVTGGTYTTDVQNEVIAKAGGLALTAANITVTAPSSPSWYVQVVATFQYTPITPGLSLILGGNNIPLTATSRAMVAAKYHP